MPFFSIIIPSYNRAHMLPVAIQSVINQTYHDWELIIVDDGSTDNTKEVVASYNHDRIIYIWQANQERSVARNNGIKNAKGEYVCFLDSDDYYLPDRLKKFNEFILKEKHSKLLIFSGIIIENKGGFNNIEIDDSLYYKINIFDYLTSIIIATPQICVSASILEEFNFNPDFRLSEDMELCFRIAKKYPVVPQKDNLTIVQYEHEDRTVGYRYCNTSKEQIVTWRYILNKDHSGRFISKKYKNGIMGQLFFNEAKYFMFNNLKYNAIAKIFKSIVVNPINNQNKHRLYCLINLLLLKIPDEYLK